MSGFVRLDRAAFEHPMLRDPKRFRAWFWMVAKACWKPRKYDINGKVIDLNRGQFVASRNQLAKEWDWSPSAVERFLTRLETEQMIGRETGQGRSIITIRNYNRFNPIESLSGQDNGQATGQAPDRHRTAKEQGNKGTSKNTQPRATICPDDFWPSPSPDSKTAAEMATWSQDRTEREVERFKAYHQNKGSKFPNWQRAWTTWALSDFQKAGKQNVRQPPSNRSAADLTRQKLAGLGQG